MPQHFFIHQDEIAMLPKAGLIVLGRGKQIRSQIDAQEIEHPRQRGRAAAMHSQDDDAIAGVRRRIPRQIADHEGMESHRPNHRRSVCAI